MAFRQSCINLSKKSKSKSASWAARQTRDPFVKRRITESIAYRARSAYKLLEIDDSNGGFLSKMDVHAVVDLGAAPGGWSQVVAHKLGWHHSALKPLGIGSLTRAVEPTSVNRAQDSSPSWFEAPPRLGKKRQKKAMPEESLMEFNPLDIDDVQNVRPGRGTILAVDLLDIVPIRGVKTLKADFMYPQTAIMLRELLQNPQNPQGKADIILSDMAANVSGEKARDVESSLQICEAVFQFAQQHLRTAEEIGRPKGGVLLIKFFSHPLLEDFRNQKLEPNFRHVYYAKPKASREESSEGYYLCLGWSPKI